MFNNKSQNVSIGRGSELKCIIQHEVSHALNLFYEQSKQDRNKYLNIHWINITPYMRFNLDKSSITETETFIIQHVYDSNMQYERMVSSNNG